MSSSTSSCTDLISIFFGFCDFLVTSTRQNWREQIRVPEEKSACHFFSVSCICYFLFHLATYLITYFFVLLSVFCFYPYLLLFIYIQFYWFFILFIHFPIYSFIYLFIILSPFSDILCSDGAGSIDLRVDRSTKLF
jgi:hypothetical protein